MEARKSFSASAAAPRPSSSSSLFFLLLLLPLFVSPSIAHIMSVVEDHPPQSSSPSVASHEDLQDLARFAVDQHNSRQNSDLEFVAVVSANHHVVSGLMYHLKVKASSGGQTNLYEAKIWVKPWLNFKSLEEFKKIEGSFTAADLGAHIEGPQKLGLQSVSCDDPSVKEAAKEALKIIQQRSNSLIPYELKEVLSAQAEMNDENTNFSLLFKVQRGTNEEHFIADLWRTVRGAWTVKDVHQHHGE